MELLNRNRFKVSEIHYQGKKFVRFETSWWKTHEINYENSSIKLHDRMNFNSSNFMGRYRFVPAEAVVSNQRKVKLTSVYPDVSNFYCVFEMIQGRQYLQYALLTLGCKTVEEFLAFGEHYSTFCNRKVHQAPLLFTKTKEDERDKYTPINL